MISTIKATDIFDFLKDTSAPDTTLSDWRDALEDADLIVSILSVGDCPAHEFFRYVTPLLAA